MKIYAGPGLTFDSELHLWLYKEFLRKIPECVESVDVFDCLVSAGFSPYAANTVSLESKEYRLALSAVRFRKGKKMEEL